MTSKQCGRVCLFPDCLHTNVIETPHIYYLYTCREREKDNIFFFRPIFFFTLVCPLALLQILKLQQREASFFKKHTYLTIFLRLLLIINYYHVVKFIILTLFHLNSLHLTTIVIANATFLTIFSSLTKKITNNLSLNVI